MWQCSPWKDTNSLFYFFIFLIFMQSQNRYILKICVCVHPISYVNWYLERKVSFLVHLSHNLPLIHKDIYKFRALYILDNHGVSERGFAFLNFSECQNHDNLEDSMLKSEVANSFSSLANCFRINSHKRSLFLLGSFQKSIWK